VSSIATIVRRIKPLHNRLNNRVCNLIAIHAHVSIPPYPVTAARGAPRSFGFGLAIAS